jgi:hypothetical protein
VVVAAGGAGDAPDDGARGGGVGQGDDGVVGVDVAEFGVGGGGGSGEVDEAFVPAGVGVGRVVVGCSWGEPQEGGAVTVVREILECGASVNLCMAHGGTSFAGWAGANRGGGALHEGSLKRDTTYARVGCVWTRWTTSQGSGSGELPVDGTVGAPAGLYRGTVTVRGVGEARLELPGYTRGFVWINGFDLGRYWSAGP